MRTVVWAYSRSDAVCSALYGRIADRVVVGEAAWQLFTPYPGRAGARVWAQARAAGGTDARGGQGGFWESGELCPG